MKSQTKRCYKMTVWDEDKYSYDEYPAKPTPSYRVYQFIKYSACAFIIYHGVKMLLGQA